jgi:hypothetical protein
MNFPESPKPNPGTRGRDIVFDMKITAGLPETQITIRHHKATTHQSY